MLLRVSLISKILLALDDSARAPRVAAAGGLLAARFGASLHPLRVVLLRPGSATNDALPESQARDASSALAELSRSLMDALVAPPRVRVGEPWRVIVELANEIGADLIVLGARGQHEDALGATASGVLAHALQDVFLVRDAVRRSVLPS